MRSSPYLADAAAVVVTHLGLADVRRHAAARGLSRACARAQTGGWSTTMRPAAVAGRGAAQAGVVAVESSCKADSHPGSESVYRAGTPTRSRPA
jgi:hypothetical protein